MLRDLLEEILASEGVSYEPAVLPVVIRAGAGSARDSLSILDQLLAGSGDEGLTYERAIALLGYTDDEPARRGRRRVRGRGRRARSSGPWTGWSRAATTRGGSPPTCSTGCAT